VSQVSSPKISKIHKDDKRLLQTIDVVIVVFLVVIVGNIFITNWYTTGFQSKVGNFKEVSLDVFPGE